MRQLLDTIGAAGIAPGGREQLLPVWFYLLRVSELELQQVHDLLAERLGDRIGDDVKTTAGRLIRETYQ